ncbi:MAG TPA: DUF4369 domain-containing protein, partial [Chitinophagales bacterium]|nr:DUF4369 domain-containing protein [Chitinophagales bacterium]
MKRTISSLAFYFIISLLLFSSCKNFNGYKISGKIKNGDGVKVYLEDITEEVPLIIDTATISKSAFQLKNYTKNGIYRLRFGEDAANTIFLFIQEKDN